MYRQPPCSDVIQHCLQRLVPSTRVHIKSHASPHAGQFKLYTVLSHPNDHQRIDFGKGNSSRPLIIRRPWSTETYNKFFSPDVTPIKYATECLQYVHTTTGLPWWASIALTTFAVRTLMTFPTTVYSQHIIARVENIQPEIKALAKELKMEVLSAKSLFGWSEKKAAAEHNTTMKSLIRKLYIRDNCHPVKASVVIWLQIPVWLSMSFSLRNICGWVPSNIDISTVYASAMANEGLLWFPNLMAPDTTWILPLILGIVNFANIEMSTLRPQKPSKFMTAVTWFMRVITIWLVILAGWVPSAMSWYWTCSSVCGLLNNVMLKIPSVRRACRIPKANSESDTPFSDMLSIAKQRYLRR